LTALFVYSLNFNKYKTLTTLKKCGISDWKFINKRLLNCKLTKFTVRKINFNKIFLQNLIKSNLSKGENSSLNLKFRHMQVVNEVILNIKNTDLRKMVCFSLTSSDMSNHAPNTALYNNEKLRNGIQFLNESQTMVLESEILNESNTITNPDCLDIMNSIEKEGSESIVADLVDSTICRYKGYIINHIHNCSHKACYECFNLYRSPEGKILIELIKTKTFFY